MASGKHVDDSGSLDQVMQRVPETQRILVGFSGGLDSSVLMVLASRLALSRGVDIKAIHVNHGLSPCADDWATHCVRFAGRLNVDCIVERCHVQTSGEGLEAAARDARYTVFRRHLLPGDVLLLGHHLDDQAETVLYRVIKGKSVPSLAGIPALRTLSLSEGQATLYRPFLSTPRRALSQFAQSEGLRFIHDESNDSDAFDRNYLRHKVFPSLQQRWPGVLRQIERTAQQCAEAGEILSDLAAQDLRLVTVDQCLPVVALSGWSVQSIDLQKLGTLTAPRQRNLLTHWLQSSAVGWPGQKNFSRLLTEVLQAKNDARAVVAWTVTDGRQRRTHEARVHEGRLLVGPAWTKPAPVQMSVGSEAAWLDGRIQLLARASPEAQRRDTMNAREMAEFRFCLPKHIDLTDAGRFEVRGLSPGEKLRLSGRPEKKLVRLMKEAGVPYWLRDCLPVLRWRGQVIGVPGVGVNESVSPASATNEDESGFLFRWLK